MKQYTLSELCAEIQDVIKYELEERYWVRAEIASLSARGHCYMELVEKAEDNMLAAKVRATCWSNVWSLLSGYFVQETGQTLRVGMQVLVEASVDFHPVYGLSLNITNIDPTYTQGDLAKQRQATIKRLTKDGVMELQKYLVLPTLIRRVAVISAADAAGYGDFCDQLQNNRYGVRFELELFAAAMQGENAPRSILSALHKIACEERQWDIVVIIRGGGATTDLGCFDDYELASHCAQFPLPILSGIGHTRDMSIVDMVAHSSVKTPTAAAEWLIERVAKQVEVLNQWAIRLQRATQHAVTQEHNKLQGYLQDMIYSAQKRVMKEQNKLQMWTKTIDLHSPERIFKMGYSLTMLNGKPVMSKEDVKQGDVLKTYIQDGAVESVVKES
jgi:exodeoxyribonuclease VII large subunit